MSGGFAWVCNEYDGDVHTYVLCPIFWKSESGLAGDAGGGAFEGSMANYSIFEVRCL